MFLVVRPQFPSCLYSPQLLWITLFISLSVNGFPSHCATSDTTLPRN